MASTYVKPALVMAAGWLAATMALAMPAPAAAQTASRCLLEVDGHRYIDGRCRFTPQGEGSFQIRGLGRAGYFATVLVDGREADGFWNGREQGNHAHARLGAGCGVLPGLDWGACNRLLVRHQGAHLELAAGRALDGRERAAARADLLREHFAAL